MIRSTLLACAALLAAGCPSTPAEPADGGPPPGDDAQIARDDAGDVGTDATVASDAGDDTLACVCFDEAVGDGVCREVVGAGACAARGCWSPCPTIDHGVATCDAFARCAIECEVGHVRIAGGCVPATIAPPRPISPLSTQRVTTRRPTLRFALAPGVAGMHVEMCRDRACSRPEIREDVVGGDFVPPWDLGPGVWWYRAFGVARGARGEIASPTWQISVPHVPTGRDLAWGASRDLDGDAIDDLLITSGGTPRIYRGGSSLDTSPPALALPSGRAAIVGDVNGDGRADVAWWSTGSSATWLSIAYGASSIASMTLVEIETGTSEPWIEHEVFAAGDVDGDGIGDVAIGCPICAGRQGQTFVYRGSESGLRGEALAITSPYGHSYNYFGTTVGGSGDVDGDGWGDLTIASPGSPSGLFVFRGMPDGPAWSVPDFASDDPWVPDARFDATESAGVATMSPVDLDGDGRATITAWIPYDFRVHEWSGADVGPGPMGAGTTTHPEECGVRHITAAPYAAVLGDVDLDGSLDRAIGSCDDALLIERAGAWTLQVRSELLGATLVGGLDLDADGAFDLVLDRAGTSGTVQPSIVLYGGSDGLGTRSAELVP